MGSKKSSSLSAGAPPTLYNHPSSISYTYLSEQCVECVGAASCKPEKRLAKTPFIEAKSILGVWIHSNHHPLSNTSMPQPQRVCKDINEEISISKKMNLLSAGKTFSWVIWILENYEWSSLEPHWISLSEWNDLLTKVTATGNSDVCSSLRPKWKTFLSNIIMCRFLSLWQALKHNFFLISCYSLKKKITPREGSFVTLLVILLFHYTPNHGNLMLT